MSNYAEILRHSRLMALPPRIKSSGLNNLYPTSQAIQTSKASQAIGDWGLKRNLPRLKTDNITISDIDTQEHQTPFQSGNKFTKFIKRWQEMGIPIRSRQQRANTFGSYAYNTSIGSTTASDFPSNGIHLSSAPRKQVLQLVKKANRIRRPFLSRQAKGAIYTQKVLSELRTAGQEALRIQASTNRPYNMHASGGLASHAHGTLALVNTPNGPQERVVTARVLHSARNQTLVGVGGLQTELKQRYDAPPKRAHGRTHTFAVYPTDAEVTPTGALSVALYDSRPNQFDSDRASGITAYDSVFSDVNLSKGFEDDEMESPADAVGGGKSGTMSQLTSLLRNSPVGKQ